MLIVSVLSAVPMHQRFSLKATLRIDLSDVYQFTFHNQLELVTYFFEQTEFNATVCHFADIISLRRRHNSLGPIRVIGEHLVDLKFYLNKIFDLMLTYGGIRALNISNLAASAYGLSLGFL